LVEHLPQVHRRGLVEVALVGALGAVPQVEVAGGVGPAGDGEADDALAAYEVLGHVAADAGVLREEGGRAVDAVQVPLQLTDAERVVEAVAAHHRAQPVLVGGDGMAGVVEAATYAN